MNSEELQSYKLFVDGEFRESTGERDVIVDFPYNGEEWARVPDGTKQDIDEAVEVARAAFERDEWRGLLPRARRELLNDIADVIDEHAEELAEIVTWENGKLLRENESLMNTMGEWYRYYGRLCDEMGEGRTISVHNKDGNMFNYTRKEPYGVVGAITPWNAPLLLTTWKLAPALAAGNTFVHKPSEQTPVGALRFAELIYRHTDLPDGVYNVVPGRGETGAALASNPDVDKLAFTGSTAVGREVAKKAGENLSPVSLELGGKSPNIIFPTADLNEAVKGVMKGVFSATGQSCQAGSRVIVHEDIHDEFVEKLTARAEDLQLGDPRDPSTELGPVAFRDQFEKVRRYISKGNEEGAKLQSGGEQPEDLPGDCFVQPTVFVDVDTDMTIAQEEIFGPVASVIPFSTEEEALELANDVDYGLAGAVWTKNMNRARRFAEGICAGTVWVNEYKMGAPNSPFGGFKDSGIGRENGREGLEEYYQVKSIWYDHSDEVGDPSIVDIE